MIQSSRIQVLNGHPETRGKFVIYWMQAAQRTYYNHALEYAVEVSNYQRLPLIVVFCLVDKYPSSNRAHYRFMIEGLQEVQKSLETRKIPFYVVHESPESIIPKLAEDASIVIVDRDYQRAQRKWRMDIANTIECPMHQVETNVIVPIETVTSKEEYSAGTIRPKIQRNIEDYLVPVRKRRLKIQSEGIGLSEVDLSDIDRVLKQIKFSTDHTQNNSFVGGTTQATKLLRSFITKDLDVFGTERNDPSVDKLSCMSPYLHFGQISPLNIALEIQKTNSPGRDTYLEELIIRRELSMNFVFFNSNYDNFESLPNWAKETLEVHSFDKRDYVYTFKELQNAQTHDPYWNAAQKEMVQRGKMHGYLRMYWGKKILEWMESPSDAYETCIRLNDMYELDGRDPNGYAGVAWCFGKHDRAWEEREIFGKVRYMNDKGLKRKFDIEAYVKRIDKL